MSRLEAYKEVVPKGTVEFLMLLAEKVQGKRMLEINSTQVGGGVAEILRSLVPLFREIGLDCRWEVISGTEEFFNVTKSFHNALQGREQISPPGCSRPIWRSIGKMPSVSPVTRTMWSSMTLSRRP